MVRTDDFEHGCAQECPRCIEEDRLLRIAAVDPPRYYPVEEEKPRRGWWSRLKRWYKARFRTDLQVVCEMSQGMGLRDYHDYPDTESGQPFHMVSDFCVRCGKEFMM